MHLRLALIIGLVMALASACSGAAPEATTPAPSTPTAASDETTEPTSESEAPTELALPGDVTLEAIGGSSVSGDATFARESGDDVAITVTLQGTQNLMFDAFALLVLPGACADQSEPPDFAGALDSETVDLGEEADTPVVVSLSEVLASPHVIMVTNAPGDRNLACGQIVG